MAADRWWTDERVDELKARWRDGESAREIARNMDATSRNAVIGKAHRVGLIRIKVTALPKPKRQRKTLRYVDHRYVKGEETVKTEPPPPSFVNPIRFFDLREQHCRWPGAGEMPDLLFCGEPKLNGYSYCPHHCRIAFAKPGSPPKAPR